MYVCMDGWVGGWMDDNYLQKMKSFISEVWQWLYCVLLKMGSSLDIHLKAVTAELGSIILVSLQDSSWYGVNVL